jgi:hypothetical protein
MAGLDTEAVKDVKVVTSDRGTWESCKLCLRTIGNSSHVMVLQDDVLPCRDLLRTATKMIELLPDKPITLFTSREQALTAKAVGNNWMTVKAWFMAQAYILPKSFIDDFFAWDEIHGKQDQLGADDEHLALYCYCNEIRVWAAIPSLVEHLGWRSTTIGERDNKDYLKVARRIASTFIGFEQSGLDVDWSKGIDKPHEDTWGSWDQFSNWYKEE